uniref:Uncharacterized protein n=1 Tax=Myotis myotis TaxID=51298 RepID=A0A7J7Y0M0_MYOMY|nr:hypothetical protein mMyoMyo1_011498 [Myotis myotis]
MEKRKHDSLIFCMGLDGLKIWASGFSALVLSLGAAVGLIGFSIYYLSPHKQDPRNVLTGILSNLLTGRRRLHLPGECVKQHAIQSLYFDYEQSQLLSKTKIN